MDLRVALRCWKRFQHEEALDIVTLTLDKNAGKATLQQKILFWSKKPVEFALTEIDDIAGLRNYFGETRRDDLNKSVQTSSAMTSPRLAMTGVGRPVRSGTKPWGSIPRL